jgi:hypothetical protein
MCAGTGNEQLLKKTACISREILANVINRTGHQVRHFSRMDVQESEIPALKVPRYIIV